MFGTKLGNVSKSSVKFPCSPQVEGVPDDADPAPTLLAGIVVELADERLP